jgi:hypothetical protein
MFPKYKYNASLKNHECVTNIPYLNTSIHVTTQNHFRNVIDPGIVLHAGNSQDYLDLNDNK